MVMTLLWTGWYNTLPLNTHAQKRAGYTFIQACVCFLSHLRLLSAHNFVRVPPVRNSYPGWHGTHSSPFLTTERAFVFILRKNVQNQVSFRGVPLGRSGVHSCNPPCYTQRAGCEALSAVSLYTYAFVSGLDLDPNEHNSYLVIIDLNHIAWYCM